MKSFHSLLSIILCGMSLSLSAQQLPNSNFEDWSGAAFDGNAQPASWNYSNVTQTVLGITAKFNFAHKEAGRNGGWCMMVQDQDLKVAGIGETSPGYVALGRPWAYLEGTKIDEATGGTSGGISWTYRPDTIAVWIKRTGSHWQDEDFHILYYSWSGTAQNNQYKSKNGKGCTSVACTDEESDIRIATNANDCGTNTPAHQVAEGWLRARAKYDNWTLIKVPIYYLDNVTPEKVNVIFSAGNYPNFRHNDGLYAGNSLYVDDVRLIYSSRIQKLFIGGAEWSNFDPNSTEIQYYSIPLGQTTMPPIKAFRGAGDLTNSRGITAQFLGRQLQGNEIDIEPGVIDETPTKITVTAEDGSSQTVYQILFTHPASSNAYLDGIQVNGVEVPNFSAYISNYTVDIPFGQTTSPIVSVTKQEDKQTVTFSQPTSLDDVTTITVTAADKTTQQVYTLRYREAELSDNTLVDIQVNGNSLPDFSPTKTNYNVSIPVGTTQMPQVDAISKYAAGAQTIEKIAPAQIDGGTYQIKVSSPGNPTPKTYKLTFKLEPSSYCKLKDIQIGKVSLSQFHPDSLSYAVTLPMGTVQLPEITYTAGDPYQTISITTAGVDGTTRITVTAANGDQKVYKIDFSTPKSSLKTLNGILLDGEPLADFQSDQLVYNIPLEDGRTDIPEITVIKGDEYQKVTIIKGDLHSATRITVTAGDGSIATYQLTFSAKQLSDPTLLMIKVGGESLANFQSDVFSYDYPLAKGTTELPKVEYVVRDQYQSVTTRSAGVNGDYKIIVRAQDRSTATYTIHFSVPQSTNTALQMIYLDGQPIADFNPEKTDYTDTLDVSTIPSVTYLAEQGQSVISLLDDNVHTIKVTAENKNYSRTYTITFVVRKSESAFLKMIYLDGDSLDGFQPDRLSYTDLYLSTQTCPHISVDSEDGQQVSILAPYSAGTASIIVQAAAGGKNTYLLQFIDTSSTIVRPIEPEPEYIESSDIELKDILINGESLSDFNPTTHTYTLSLPTGSVMPVITFVPKNDKQSLISGPIAYGKYTTLVTAENGNTASDTVLIQIAQHTSAYLEDLQVEGHDLRFEPTQLNYTLSIAEGQPLPQLTYVAKEGQHIMQYDNWNSQTIIVTAENGSTNTYLFTYTREKSTNALLSDIILDGVSLADFDPQQFNYTDSLAWRTEVVPSVNAIGQGTGQVITTCFSAVNHATTIHVVAQDGITTADYTISFPVRKSSNTELSEMYLETEYAVDLEFDPAQTDYTLTLPTDATMSPRILFAKAEKEQTITYTARPIGQANTIKVTAENGDERTYTITFVRATLDEPNVLKSIYVIESSSFLDLTDATQREFDVQLPFGTQSMTISYTKQYSGQTVLVQPGGIDRPTILTVQSNQAEVADAVYTLRPTVGEDPAVLTNIKVNDSNIEGFNPNQFSYIVPITSSPIVVPTYTNGVQCNTLIQTSKHWQAQVSKDGFTNTYDLWFYYPNDVIPNSEFTEWTTAKYNNAVKPVGWQMLADYFDQCSAFRLVCLGSNTSDEHLEKEGSDRVHLITEYKCNMARAVPSFITLGTITGSYNTSSTFQVSGGIPFRNSPDLFQINYKQDQIANNNLIRFEMTGEDGFYSHDWTNSQTHDYNTFTFDLNEVNKSIGEPKSLNITINSYYSFTGDLGTGKTSASMYIDWVRFAYNHTLTGVKVNGNDATLTGNIFSYELDNSDNIAIPQLTFTGEVADQAQKVEWADEVINGQYATRTASIRNYAENGDYTDYTLHVKRPLSTINTLSKLLINGSPYADFAAQTTDYVITLPSGERIPDIYPYPASVCQTIATSINDNVVTITVQPEYGETKTYTLTFTHVQSANVQLTNITGLDNFASNVYNYTIEGNTLPDMNFLKAEDCQTVKMQEGIFTVTAENGTQQVYSVTLNRPTTITSGQLSSILLDDELLPNFSPNQYAYTGNQPSLMSFVRQDAADSVVYIRQDNQLSWHVIGTEEHTYTLTSSHSLSSTTTLDAIYVNDALLDGFDAQLREYTIYSDSNLAIRPIAGDIGQMLNVTYTESTYTINVTAEDGTIGEPYRLHILPTISSDATLSAILLDGTMLTDFQPNEFQYDIIVPCSDFKAHEPMLPTINFVPTSDKASVEVVAGGLGEKTYLIVTAQDGIHTQQYELYFTVEPSHNAELSAIIVNGVFVEHFEPQRHYYSILTQLGTPQIEWRSLDKFNTVTMSCKGDQYTLHVTAQDGTTTSDYIVEIFTQVLSNDATLSMIQLDQKDMSTYYAELNPDLTFSPGQNRYTINLPLSIETLPEISASLKAEGQSLTLRHEDMNIYIDVTAPDGSTTNTYTLRFARRLSIDTHLKMIYLDGDSLTNFQPDQLLYFINLQPGEHTLPEIYPIKKEKAQSIDTTHILSPVGEQVNISVTAEDSHYSAQYTLIFRIQPSQNDTLQMIYVDEEPLEEFHPTLFSYDYILDADKPLPNSISYEKGDKYQSVRTDTLVYTDFQHSWRCTVTAESGSKNSYTITYTIIPSSNNTLQMIFLNGDSLANFTPLQTEYICALPHGTPERPLIFYTQGDKYQQVQAISSDKDLIEHSLGTDTLIVTAQDGSVRNYVLHYPVEYSSDTTLSMIYCNSVPLPNFDEHTHTYKVQLCSADAYIPAITWTKNHTAQMVDIGFIDSSCVQLHVTAEDKQHTATYTLNFLPFRSSDNQLRAIYLDSVIIPEYDPIRDNYEFTIDSLSHLPLITWDSLPTQQVSIDTDYVYNEESLIREVIYTIQVIAEDLSTKPYELLFHIRSNIPLRPEDSDNARLANIYIDNQPISITSGFDADFMPDSLNYHIIYPIGYNPELFFSIDQITCVAQDSLATIVTPFNTQIIAAAEDTLGQSVPTQTCIHITVQAPNGNQQTYHIYQTLLLDSLNRTTSLQVADLNGVLREIKDFDADIYYYEYIIPDTRDNAPDFALLFENTTSRFACARFERGNNYHVVEADDRTNYANIEGDDDPTYHITYRAENGKRFVYKIKFRRSEIKRSETPMSGDVLIQHIPGSYQIAVASLRANVTFGLYDMNGVMIQSCQLQESNPNNFNLTTDGFGQIYFGHVSDYSDCTIFTLQPNKIYFWAFLENGKRKIRSGKLVIQP